MSKTIDVELDGRHQSLVDINDSLVNFEAKISFIPKDGDKYQIAIVDQEMLDKASFEFDSVSGPTVRVLIVADNKYQNYYAVLKSEKEMKVPVEIECNEVHVEVPVEDTQRPAVVEKFKAGDLTDKSWKYILLLIIVIVGAILLKKFWKD